MEFYVNLLIRMSPFIIIIFASLILRRVLNKPLGETHPVNSYVLLVIPVMSILAILYIMARPFFTGDLSFKLTGGMPFHVTPGNYSINEKWRTIDDFRRGDMIVYRQGTHEPYFDRPVIPKLRAGRVVGMGGDRLHTISEKIGKHFQAKLFCNNRDVTREAPHTQMFGSGLPYGLTVPRDSLWVVVDDARSPSARNRVDSHFFGPVKLSQVVGRINVWSAQDIKDHMNTTGDEN